MENELYQEINKVLSNEIVDRHSFFQLKYFVLGKEPTHQARLWRCLKELESRKDSINAINLEILEANDNLLLLELDIQEIKKYPETNPKQEINLRKLLRRKTELEIAINKLGKKLKFTEEEANFFLAAFRGLEKAQPLVSFDNVAAQEEYWNEKLSQELNFRILLKQPLDPDLVKTILSLNSEAPIKKQLSYILGEIEASNKKVTASLTEQK